MNYGLMDLSMFVIPRPVVQAALTNIAMPFIEVQSGNIDQLGIAVALDVMLAEAAATARDIVFEEGGNNEDVEQAVWVIIHSIQAALLPLQ